MALGRSAVERLAMGLIAGLVAFGLAYMTRPRGAGRTHKHVPNALESRSATFELVPGAAQLAVRSLDGKLSRDIDLEVVVDGAARPLVIGRGDMHPTTGAAGAMTVTFPLTVDDGIVDADMELRVDRLRNVLDITLAPPAGFLEAGHTLALRADLASAGQVVFVSGVGQLADRATVIGASLLVDADPHPLALVSSAGPITVDAVPDDASLAVQPMRLSVQSPPIAMPSVASVDLRVVVGDSSMSVWQVLAEVASVPTAHVDGRVLGQQAGSLVFGRDAQGNPAVRARAGTGGAFALDVPTSVVEWYAAVDPGRASSLVSFMPGTPHDLLLDIAPGGDLHVTIKDADTRTPLTARLLVHGENGTLDPSFGPDYRASGAGPVIDALRGDVTTPLPSGRYRVAATKGIEWSIDAKVIDIAPGRVTDVELAPRHVVPTPGVLGCDLHVHARPSFDTPVTPEDRVLSLVAAGIDFAVPSEHNVVGDYASSLDTLDLGKELLSVPGVEVTTYSKGFGHFGVFPYPPGSPVPPYKHTNMASIFRAVRAGDPNRYFQLNHPRLPKGLGYFNNIGFDPKGPRNRIHNRIDFDGIEVFNGYDSELPERVEQVLHDYWALLGFGYRYTATGSSDSHRIQFHWAGYPRTMVTVDPQATVDEDNPPSDPLTVVAQIKKGHATVTDGPILEFELHGVRPGDEVVTQDEVVHAHLRVRTAPWVDVGHVDVFAGEIGGTYRVVQSFELPPRKLQLGPEPGTLEEAQARTIRFDQDFDVALGPANAWVMVVARGDRPMDDILPFMPLPPMGFTNPVYVVRHRVPAPPFPGVPGAPVAPVPAPPPSPSP
ncbi:MAG TPA: CehA/McbA family metallohydrolase [Polyangiaceae bacterium]|nr:CehA/McbA family metallohydrolase [Polyangiaceae bacterium]